LSLVSERELQDRIADDISHEEKLTSSNPIYRMLHRANLETVTRCVPAAGYVLDVGCGDGVYLKDLKAEEKVGIDISFTRLRRANKASADASLILCSADNLPFSDQVFSTVICSQVLEHMRRLENVIEEVERVTRHKGLIIVGYPHEFILRFLRAMILKPPVQDHIHWLNKSKLSSLFKNSKIILSQNIPDFFPTIIALDTICIFQMNV
jgi:ubiquinone/menaquinone biosynthesis C-methylase UbiE